MHHDQLENGFVVKPGLGMITTVRADWDYRRHGRYRLTETERGDIWGVCAAVDGLFGEPRRGTYELFARVPEGAQVGGWVGSRVWMVPDDDALEPLLEDAEAPGQLLGDRVFDPASSQVAAVAAGTVGLVAADVAGPGPGPSAQRPGDSDPVQDLDQLRGIAPLTRREQQGHGTASTLAGEVDLAGQTAPGPPESLIGAVVPGRRPFFGTRGLGLRAPAACW